MASIRVEAWSRGVRPEVRIVVRNDRGQFAGTNRRARAVVGRETATRLGFRPVR